MKADIEKGNRHRSKSPGGVMGAGGCPRRRIMTEETELHGWKNLESRTRLWDFKFWVNHF